MSYLLCSGKSIPLTKETIIGRHSGCTLPISEPQASRQHARLWSQDGGWWVEDLHSANGTAVNQRKMLAGPVRLTNGDRIGIGAFVFEYHDGQPNSSESGKTPDHFGTGTKVGIYTIDAPLGDGVATTIYKASYPGGQVALHIIDPALVADDEAFAKRFLGDIELAANVRHPGAVRIHRAGSVGRTAWYSTDLVGGENLAHKLGSPMEPKLALDFAISLGDILAAYSGCGLVHGDLKPRSLALAGERAVHLMDIGLIGLNDATRQRAQSRGTTRQVYYLCPVQAKRGDCNARSDLYSIGCMLVQMLTGRPPFTGPDFNAIMAAHERDPVPTLSAQLQLPAMLDEIISGLLHKDPFFRFDTTAVAVARFRELRTLIAAR